MVTGLFGTLLEELAKSLKINHLEPDQNNSCLINLKNGQKIQVELDRSGNYLVIGADLGTVSPGKYRENLFKEALKANGMPYPLNGILAYSKRTDHLVLFTKISVKDLRGEQIAIVIPPFVEKALIWSEAIKRGEMPSLSQVKTSGASSGMFGLRP
ncbi:MAG: CesT family type III secretion system chaperone [Parachlamydiaceae bacterium]